MPRRRRTRARSSPWTRRPGRWRRWFRSATTRKGWRCPTTASALWVALAGERRVRRMTPGATPVPGPVYSLPMLLTTGEPAAPISLVVLPGTPSSIAVNVYGANSGGRGVFILDDGLPRANFIQPPEVGANFLTNGPPGYLFARRRHLQPHRHAAGHRGRDPRVPPRFLQQLLPDRLRLRRRLRLREQWRGHRPHQPRRPGPRRPPPFLQLHRRDPQPDARDGVVPERHTTTRPVRSSACSTRRRSRRWDR